MQKKIVFRWGLLVLSALVAVDAELFLMAKRARHQVLEQARVNLRVAADVVLGRADQELDTYDRTLSGIGEMVSARGTLPVRADLGLHRLLVRRHSITPGLHSLLLVREDGMLAESSFAFPSPSVDISDRDYYRTQVRDWEQGLFIGAPLESRIDRSGFIPLSRRLVNDGSRFLGVIMAGIAPESLERLLADQALPPGYTLRLMLDSGQALVCRPADVPCRERNWGESAFFRRITAGQVRRGAFDSLELSEAEPGMGAYASSDRYPIVVAASVDEDRLLAGWRDGLRGYVLLALVSNLALVGVAILAFRQFQRRRQALDALAEANRYLEERVVSRTEALRRSEAQARAFLNTAKDAVVVIDGRNRIVEFNRAAERMFGYAAPEAAGQGLDFLMPVEEFACPGQGRGPADGGAAALGVDVSCEAIGRHRDGRHFPVEVTIGGTHDGKPPYVGVIRDISERKAIEEELRRLATLDGLTGALNRRAFTEQAEKQVVLARRHRRPWSLLLLDADKFKKINDTYGHPVGDEVLRMLVGTLGGQLRSTDLLGRLGGEEFGIALPETDLAGAHGLANRTLEAVRLCRVAVGAGQIAFTVSIGIASLDLDGDDSLEAALRRADEALYRAKGGGRDRLAVALPGGFGEMPEDPGALA
ncbi:MAG TPA: diguanylate cyclase [Rhodocyclaceae bacterium]|nr:diguanylate cyclase [Rhodocyclaceae bacterium]